jgi:Ca2+-binding EF-hand superfamily protein
MSSNEVYFDIPVVISDPFEKTIFKAFTIYDHNNVNMVDAKDVGAILRSLGCVPSENDVRDMIEQTEFPSHPGDVHLSNFMPYLKKQLVQKKMKPSPAEDLLKAFKVFDPKNKGFISKEIFLEMLTDYGDEMSDDEVKQMAKSAVDPSDDKVYYEIYIRQLMHEPKKSIYKLAAKYGVTRKSDVRKLKLQKRMN